MSTISTLAYKILIDQSGFTKGATLAAKEANNLKRLFVETRTPLEKYQAAVQQLGGYYARGAVDADLYRRALAKMHQEFKDSIPFAEKVKEAGLGDALKQTAVGANIAAVALNPYVLAVGAVTVAAGAAALTLKTLCSESIKAALGGIDFVDSQDEMAKKIGVSIDVLMALRKQAKGVGVDESTVSSAIQNMGVNIATGNGGASKAIKDLGLSVSDLQRMNPGQAYSVISAEISKLPSAALRAAAATEIFGKAGKDMLGMFASGSIDKQIDKIRQMGFGVTEGDIENIKSAQSALGDVSSSIAGIGVRAANQMAPAIEKFATELIEIATSPAVVPYLEQFFAGLGGIIGHAAKALNSMHLSLVNVSMATTGYQLLWSQITDNKSGIAAARLQLAALARESQQIKTDAAQPRAASGSLANIGTDGSAADESKRNQLVDAAKRMNSALSEAKGIYERSRTPAQEYGDEMRKLNAHLASGTISWETWGRAAKEAKDKLNKDDIDKARKLAEESKEIERKKQDAINDAVNDSRKKAMTDEQRAIQEVLKLELLKGFGLNGPDADKLIRQQAEKLTSNAPQSAGFSIAKRGSVEEFQAIQQDRLGQRHEEKIEELTAELRDKASEQVASLGEMRDALLELLGKEEG